LVDVFDSCPVGTPDCNGRNKPGNYKNRLGKSRKKSEI